MSQSSLRIGINGFGRIGRLIFRQGFDSLNITAINGTSSTETMAHLLKYDSVHGVWDKKVSSKESSLIVEDQNVVCFQEKDPDSTDWSKYVDVLIECSGRFKKSSDWKKTFSKGVQKVIVSAPASDPDFTLVYGVNQHLYQKEKHHFISNASCTTNCLAPLVKVLKEKFDLERLFFSTIHSYTNDQKLLDSTHKKDLRRARSAGLNIIPTSTGASSALSLIFPDLKNKVQGMAFRVPTANVSLLDVMAELKGSCSLDEIYQAFQSASSKDLKNILAVEEKALVSSDFIGRKESTIVDGPLMDFIEKNRLRLVAWYDNEAGFSQRIIDFIHFMENNSLQARS